MAEMSDFLENTLLNHVLRNVAFTPPTAVYLALYTTAPGEAGGGTEVSGGSYARQQVTFAAPVNGVCTNSGTTTFTNMPGATITGVALHTAATGGDMLYYKAIANKSVNAGDSFTVFEGDLTVEHQ